MIYLYKEKDLIKISLDKIKRESEISTPGSRNTVWMATYSSPSGPRTVAVKNCARFKREEALILQQLRHPNIIEFLGVAPLPFGGYAIVTEFAEKGSLYDLIKQHPDDWSDFKKQCWIKWAIEMARGLQYIHEQKYQHGDVKSPNMVITRNDTLKICDFSTARHCEVTVSTNSIRGSWAWMAPEVMGEPDPQSQTKPIVTPKSDVFSYAVVVWELLTGKAPFPGESALNMLKAVAIQRKRLEIPTACPESLRDLLTEWWDHDHTKRPSMDEILSRSEPVPTYTALYDFAAQEKVDLSFQKGEALDIIHKTGGDWWFARSTKTGQEGYVPSNYIRRARDIDTEEWYLGHISRIEAEKNLLQPGVDVQRGMFIVRDSESNPGAFSISIIDHDSVRGNNVKHYEIEKRDDDETGSFYIHERASFPTLAKLIKHHQRVADGLCTTLTYPCPRETPKTMELGNDDWKIPKKCLTLKRKIAVGQYGDVWKGMWEGKTPVAIKTLKMETGQSAFLAEANIMKKLRHPNLCQLCGICSDKEPIYIVMMWMCNGSLLNYLKGDKGSNLKLPELVDIGAQIASGMAYLESMNYIHRQLAARNVLVGDANIVKVADFGLARKNEDSELRGEGNPTLLRWAAPEVLMDNCHSIKSDVWSFGILLTELVTHGQTPYLGLGTDDKVVRHVKQGYRMRKIGKCPDALYELMLKCWDKDPTTRYTFEFLHSYLDDGFVVGLCIP
ncbi:tyrosine-protein kinase STK-like [Patiria miniata]|uniref:Tyrosine-protein kinase n=1 Tax=Patiria miniata TaxID=46514 RepID=A0A914BB04_PATMI|nr:tyrosine-protein kinase STK-like [Patiria miniata]